MRASMFTLCMLAMTACTSPMPQNDAGHVSMPRDGAMPAVDANASDVGTAPDAHAGTCGSDADCDDHAYCNGVERCVSGACMAATGSPCVGGLVCDEARDRCTTTSCATPDGDGDGHESMACGGDDCDDTMASVHPGATEVPGDAVDQNCDGSEDCYVDEDADGARGTMTTTTTDLGCTLADHRLASVTIDCCDLDAMAHPGVTAWFSTADACHSFDYDCSGTEEAQQGVVTSTTCPDSGDACGGFGTAGWVDSVPACGTMGMHFGGCLPHVVCPSTCTTQGLSCPDECGGTFCRTGPTTSVTAACH